MSPFAVLIRAIHEYLAIRRSPWSRLTSSQYTFSQSNRYKSMFGSKRCLVRYRKIRYGICFLPFNLLLVALHLIPKWILISSPSLLWEAQIPAGLSSLRGRENKNGAVVREQKECENTVGWSEYKCWALRNVSPVAPCAGLQREKRDRIIISSWGLCVFSHSEQKWGVVTDI